MLATAVILVLGLGAGILAGHLNSQRFVLTCGPDRVTAQRGRAFPPWGETSLTGPRWKAISLPLTAECRDRESETEDELASWYLAILVEQATARLTARQIVDVEVAAAQLEQALLFARSPTRRDQRKEIDRLLGDVEYWRAVAKLRAASDAMTEAAKQFEDAALKQPRHVADAAARAAQIRRLLDELGGQTAAPQGPEAPPRPIPATPPASTGAAGASPAPPVPATPVPATPVPAAPRPPASSAPPASLPPAAARDGGAPSPATPDAGVPSGGVLL